MSVAAALLAAATFGGLPAPALAPPCHPINPPWPWGAAEAGLEVLLKGHGYDANLAKQASQTFERTVTAIDGFQPRGTATATLELLLDLDHQIDRFARCDAAFAVRRLGSPFPRPTTTRWRAMVGQRLSDLDTAFPARVREELLEPRFGRAAALATASPAMMALLRTRHPELIAQLDPSGERGYRLAEERGGPNPDHPRGEDAAIGRARDQAKATLRVARKQRAAAMMARMAPAYGPWRRIDGLSYRRAGPAGVSVTLSCLALTGEGLHVQLARAGGKFAYGSPQAVNYRGPAVTVVTPGGQTSARAELEFARSETSSSYRSETNTTYYRPDRATFLIATAAGVQQAAAKSSAFQVGVTNAIGGMLDVPPQENVLTMFLGLVAPFQKFSLTAITLDLDAIRDQRSAILSVTLEEGRRTLFDLQPQAPPFTTLLALCPQTMAD